MKQRKNAPQSPLWLDKSSSSSPFEPRQTYLKAATGSHCPLSGQWAPSSSPADTRRLAQGEVMPSHSGHPVQWILIAV